MAKVVRFTLASTASRYFQKLERFIFESFSAGLIHIEFTFLCIIINQKSVAGGAPRE